MEPMINIALRAAWEAENVINRALDRPDLVKVRRGRDEIPVTNIGQQAERIILSTLQTTFPDHDYLTVIDGLHNRDGEPSEYLWIVDSLSGGLNFLHGIPHFAISIACQRRGKLEHALIVDPVRRERFSASKGQGARFNDSRIRISGRTSLSDTTLATNFNPQELDQQLEGQYQAARELALQGADIRHSGCGSLDLAWVAAGRLDGAWLTNQRTNSLAAGELLVTEAGGLVSDFNGGQSHHESGNLVCATPKCLRPMLQVIGATTGL